MRRDIQALRGFSILVVLLYHAQFGWLRGGFLGVDIFFVISGFVITSKLMEGEGTFGKQIKEFYIRRATTWNPAVLRTIQIACESANKLNKTNGVCGEAASDPYLAAVLLGLGVTSLSMVPSAIAEVREFLSTLDLATCVEVAALALNADSAQEAESLVKENLQR